MVKNTVTKSFNEYSHIESAFNYSDYNTASIGPKGSLS